MDLQAGLSIAVAPRFEMGFDPRKRLQLNSGSERDASGFCARADWRAPTQNELALLVSGDAMTPSFTDVDIGGVSIPPPALPVVELSLPGAADERETSTQAPGIALFNIPERLRTQWWAVAEKQDEDPQLGRELFDGFAREVAEYLQFKGLPLPASVRFDVVISEPGRRSTRVDPTTHRPLGLAPSMPAATLVSRLDSSTALPRLLGAVNLGDEATSVVLLNLPPERMNDQLERAGQRRRDAMLTVGELAAAFLGECPGYPLVRLRLEPGEGYWLGNRAVVLDDDSLDKQQVDIRLVLRS